MPHIPKNNLKERMVKLGYNPDLAKITPPVLDNSRVAKVELPNAHKTYSAPTQKQESFEPLEFINVDDWSDFEEDE